MPKKIKKDFDMEKMYSKIMPTIVAVADRADTEEPDGSPPIGQGDADQSPALHNYMEDLLLEKLPHTMKVLSVCDCPRCKGDILALALNQLPAAYAVAEAAEQPRHMKKLRGVYEVKATASLIKAIQQVKLNPRH